MPRRRGGRQSRQTAGVLPHAARGRHTVQQGHNRDSTRCLAGVHVRLSDGQGAHRDGREPARGPGEVQGRTSAPWLGFAPHSAVPRASHSSCGRLRVGKGGLCVRRGAGAGDRSHGRPEALRRDPSACPRAATLVSKSGAVPPPRAPGPRSAPSLLPPCRSLCPRHRLGPELQEFVCFAPIAPRAPGSLVTEPTDARCTRLVVVGTDAAPAPDGVVTHRVYTARTEPPGGYMQVRLGDKFWVVAPETSLPTHLVHSMPSLADVVPRSAAIVRDHRPRPTAADTSTTPRP